MKIYSFNVRSATPGWIFMVAVTVDCYELGGSFLFCPPFLVFSSRYLCAMCMDWF
jgi:hypothetical protein